MAPPPPQPQSIDHSIQTLNIALAGSNLSFYKCHEDHFNNSDYYEISEYNEFLTLYDEHHDDEALNVYIVYTINGQAPAFWTSFPSDPLPLRAIILTPIPNQFWPPSYLAYAIGVHCGLLLTTTLAFPPNGSCPIDPSQPCEGDGICDTPVDPGLGTATCANPVYTTNCVDAAGQAQTFTYAPDLLNVMAWPRLCGPTINFSPEQIQVLEAFASINLDFTPDPCQTAFIPEWGNASRVCTPGGAAWEGVMNMGINFENYSFGANSSNSLLPGTAASGDYATRLCVFTPDDDILLAPYKVKTGSYKPSIMDSKNGLTTYDLVLMSKHILGIESLTYSSQFFAADANFSGAITTFDIVTIRKVILGITPDFPPNVGSWRFIPRYYLHTNPQFESDIFSVPNPFGLTWTDPLNQMPNKTYTSGANSFMDQLAIDLTGNPFVEDQETYSFWAIKTGDINCSGSTNFQEEENEEYELTYPNVANTISQNEYFDISFLVNSADSLTGYQFALNFDPAAMQIISPLPGEIPGFSSDNFGLTHLAEGKFRTLWYLDNGAATNFSTNKNVFTLRCHALQSISNWPDVIQLESDSLFNNAFETAEIEVPANISLQINPVSLNRKGGKYPKAFFFPNVFSEHLSLQVNVEQPGTAMVILVDAFGKSVTKELFVQDGDNSIPISAISALSPGLISYRIEVNGQLTTGKLIKQNPR